MSEQNPSLSRDYDLTHYQSHPFSDTHPDNLRTRAMLAGHNSPAVTSCRVLEIGCAVGRNILPMASGLPGSRFLGVDISAGQIEEAKGIAQRVGLSNIELRCQDLMDFPADEGEFDFIIAHGFYSWVRADVRDRLMQICGRHLSPMGAAYISYNTLPGWRLKQMVRDMMLFHVHGETDAAQRAVQARRMLAFAAQKCPAPMHYKDVVARIKQEVDASPDWYLLHEELETDNEPVYFEQFAKHAQSHGLRYVGTAMSSRELTIHLLPAAMQKQVEAFSPDPIKREQYTDFLAGKAFRQSILSRADAPRSDEPALSVVKRLYIAAYTTESGADAAGTKAMFAGRHVDNKVSVTDAGGVAAFRQLHNAWPQAVPFEELAAVSKSDPELLARNVLAGHYAGIVELWSRPTDFIARDVQRPRAPALARYQASVARPGSPVTNLRHQEVNGDKLMHVMLQLLDGSRTQEDLCGELSRLLKSGEATLSTPNGLVMADQNLGSIIDQFMKNFRGTSLLAAEGS